MSAKTTACMSGFTAIRCENLLHARYKRDPKPSSSLFIVIECLIELGLCFSPHRDSQVYTLLAAQHSQLHLVAGWMPEANIRQELALGHGSCLAVHRDDDIA